MRKLICLIIATVLGYYSAYGTNFFQMDVEEEKDSLTLPKWKELKKEYFIPIIKDTLVDKSSLYELIALFLHSQAKFTRKEKRWIENLFNTFPDSIVHNDTTTFYVHSVAKLKYYEFIKKDYKKALEVWELTREQYGNPPTTNNISEWFSATFSFYPSPFNDWSKLRIKEKMSKDKKFSDSWTDKYSMIILMDLELKTYDLLFRIYYVDADGKSCPTDLLHKTIYYDRFDVTKMILSYWDILEIPEIQRNILLCGLLSYSKGQKNDEAIQYFKPKFPSEFICNYEEFYDSGKSKLVDWEKLNNLLLGDTEIFTNDSIYNSRVYAVGEIFGKSSKEYDYIVRNNMAFVTDYKRYKHIVDEEIVRGVNDSITSLNIVNIIKSHVAPDNICKDCIIYEKHISKNHLGDFYYLWGKAEVDLRQYIKGIQHLEIAKTYTFNKDKRKNIDFIIVDALCELGNYDESLHILYKYFTESYKGSDYDKFTINHRLGNVYKCLNSEQALEYYQNANKYIDNNSITFSNEKMEYYLELSRLLSDNKYLQLQNINNALYQSTLLDLPSFITPSDSLEIGSIYTELGKYYNSLLNHSKADTCFQSALDYLKQLPLSDKRKSLLNRSYAKHLYDNKKYTRSSQILMKLKKVEYEILGKEHIDYLRTLRLLLLSTIAEKDILAAKELFKEYELIYPLHSVDTHSLEHYQVLYAYHNLIEDTEKAIGILENLVLSQQKDPIILTFSNELITLISRYKPERSEYINNAVMEKTKELVTYHFTKMSRLDRVNWQVPLYSIRSQLINTLTESRSLQSIALDFSLYSKNLLFFTQSKFDKELSKSKKNRIVMSELKAMRDSLNTAISQGDYTKIKKIDGEIESKERELYQSIQLKNPYDIKTGDVLSSLGKKELAVDFVQYESPEKEKKYGAFLLSHDLESHIFIELCNDDLIRNIAIDEKGNIQNDFYKNIASYELIWKNIIPYLSDYENIYFSGDGLLNQLGIEYICNESGERICENYRIHRVFHLANIKRTEGIGNNFVGIGVADHNSPINDSISIVDRGSWDNLNGIKQEFSTIRKSLDAHSECKTLFMIDDDAREKRIKELDNSSVTALHIATHGFYKDKKELWEAANDSTHFDHHISCRALGANKESLSGLVLRQGNISWKSATITDEYDDLLTNDEIENMTFPNLKLTVLSACDTGLGDVDSEGVWGLQRAFRIAGTESLICSLSEISDKWTAKFMDVFYKEVTSGKNIYEAFHTAQDYLFRKNKRNPQIWASMILIE